MRALKRIDVLLYEETGERFDVGDIVKINTTGTYSRELIGRILWLETLKLNLDMSKEYKTYVTEVKYDDISKIDLL